MSETAMTLEGVIYLCDVAEVSNGEGKRVALDGRDPIGVFNLDGTLHAIDDTCTHGDASLCDGEVDLDFGMVACPFHEGRFDVRTGEAVGSPCVLPVKVYPIAIVDGKVYLKEV
jgi:nitrite reductase/ring-hydroxylating ferredoxin subunit